MTAALRPAPTAPPLVAPVGMTRVGFRSMGTSVDVLLPVGLEGFVDVVIAVFESWERRCSRFDATSELSRLNAAAGGPVVVSRELFDAISRAIDASRATDGVFDPTVLRRLEALGYDRTFASIGSEDGTIDEDRETTPADGWTGAWRRIRLDRASATVDLPADVGLDLGGIAKGMAVDAAIAALAEAGVTAAAVNAGGDLAVLGTPPDAASWLIAVETIDGGELVALPHGALATSSTARRRWVRGGHEVNHLIDPRTGLPAASGVASVSVSARRCEQAEVAAKVALLLGAEAGAAFLRGIGLSGLIVDDEGRRSRVGRWLEAPAMAGGYAA